MLDKEIREKIVKIMELSIEVNGSDKYTVFTNYCGHINSFEINICYGKYSDKSASISHCGDLRHERKGSG